MGFQNFPLLHMSSGPLWPFLLLNKFSFVADKGSVSRNCTEEGWSEPFPHYFDACGFYENETEPEDQVSVCPALPVVVGRARELRISAALQSSSSAPRPKGQMLCHCLRLTQASAFRMLVSP